MARVDFSQEEHKEHTKIKEILSQTQLIEQVVAMLEKFQNMVRTCFKGNSYFERQRQAAFEEGPHKGAGRSKSRKGSVSKVVIREGEVMVDRGSIQRAKSNSCSLRRRSTSA